MDTYTQFSSIPCPACGTLLPTKARFCAKCGTALDIQASGPIVSESDLDIQEHTSTLKETPSPVSTPDMQEHKTKQKHLFISYSRKQFYFAESLALSLQGLHVPTWLDVQFLVPGSDWQQSLQQSLDSCAGLVLVASRAALDSPYVRNEWQTALLARKPIYVVLFEAVELPPELTNAAIFDFRSTFDRAVALLAESIQTGKIYRDRLPRVNPLRLPTRLPWSLWLVTGALWINIIAFAAYIILTLRIFPSITILNSRGKELALSFLLAFLGIMIYFCYYALGFTYRKGRISYTEIRMMLLAGPFTLIVCSTLINPQIEDLELHGQGNLLGFNLTVAPNADQLGTWFWLINLLLLVLGVFAFFVMPRSGAIARWLLTGIAPEKLRTRGQTSWFTGVRWKERPSNKVRTYRLHYDPHDEPIGTEIRQAFWGEGRLIETTRDRADIHLVIVTNKTSEAWVNELAQSLPNMIYIAASSIRIPKDEKSLRRFQWVDYRLHSESQLEHMRVLLCEDPAVTREYIHPAVPESLEKLVFPQSMLWISNAISMTGTYALAVGIASLVLILQQGINRTSLGVLPAISLFVGLFLFWLNDRLKTWNITYISFIIMLVIAIIGFFISRPIEFIYPTNGIGREIAWLIALLLVVAFTHQTLRDWLPKRGRGLFKRQKPRLNPPAWKQLWRDKGLFALLAVELALLILALQTPIVPVAP